jgi:acyl-CoA thioester hydrolase
MNDFSREIQLRWSDLDPNFHLRHSVYYDWGALARIEFFYAHGLTAELMTRLHFGPILFREECVFRKEIRLGDKIKINLAILKARKDYSRWTIQHEIVKNENIVSAILTVDGAFLDTVKRKLSIPPPQVSEAFSQIKTAESFQWLD